VSLAQDLRLQLRQAEEVKRDYEDRLYDIARYVNPRRELLKDSQKYDNKGLARGKDAYSGVPNSALSVWADGMQGHMVSQSLKWFKTVMGLRELNEIDEVQQYLQWYDEAMYSEYNRSNFYSVIGEWFRDAGSVGTAPLYIEEDLKNSRAVCTPMHLREIYISENMFGEVDTVFRKFFLTAKQAVEKFGTEKLNKNIIDCAKTNAEKKFEFVHAVFPNNDIVYGSILSIHKPIASVYLQQQGNPGEDGDIVQQSGYDINPYAVWRLRKNSDEIYGYSPAADALIEIKQLNQMGRTLMKAAHMSVSSPMNVPEHMRGNVRLEPDGMNYYERGGDKISPVNTSINFPIALDREEKIQRIIEDKYRVEFFLILSRAEREMTATEIMERQAEKAVLLGPQVDRLEQEGLSRVFNLIADVAEKGGRLPEPPQVLVDYVGEMKRRGVVPSTIEPQFIGPLAQAQRRLFQMQPIKNGLNELAQASVIFPEILHRIDPDKLAERILDSTDFPQDIMRTDSELLEYRKQLAIEKQQAQQAEMMAQAPDAYKKMSGKAEEGSPAEQLVGAMQK
jgi:hypothetical protein